MCRNYCALYTIIKNSNIGSTKSPVDEYHGLKLLLCKWLGK